MPSATGRMRDFDRLIEVMALRAQQLADDDDDAKGLAPVLKRLEKTIEQEKGSQEKKPRT